MKEFDPTDKNYSVYVHIFPNGKLYIGATRQVPIYRWRRGGGYKNCRTMFDAIKEFGWDNIQHIVLMEGLTQAEAMEVEKALIEKYETRNPDKGYNTMNGGQHFNNHSEEFIEAMKQRMTGNTYSVGRKVSEHHRQAISKANRGRKRIPTFTGKKHSEKTRMLISQKAKERYMSQEYREKMRASHPNMSGENNPMYGRKHSDETKAKISAKNKGRTGAIRNMEKANADRS